MRGAVIALAAGTVTGCVAAGGDPARFAPEYRGIETLLLDDDLVNFRVAMAGARADADVAAYCAGSAARYTVIRGYCFGRHVRTNIAEEGGVWRGDAVYTISPGLPRGSRTIDAEVTAAACAEAGIPTV